MTTEHPKVIADISMSLDGYVTSEGGLADLAQTSLFPSSTVAPIAPRIPWRHRFRRAVRSWRVNVGWSLEQIARRLRTFE